MEEAGFPDDVLVEILCRLPKKSRCRFKCVSKRWCSLISDRNRVIPRTNRAGFVCQSYLPRGSHLQASTNETGQPSRMSFHGVDNRGSASCLSLSHLTNIGEGCLLLSSCDGFLLFRKEWRRGERRLGDVDFVVCHPATKRSWHLRHPTDPDYKHVGLVSYGHHFKLVVFSAYANKLSQDDATYSSDEYSSENEEWSVESWRSPYITMPCYGIKTIHSAKSVFLKGAFYWIWRNYLAIYHLGKKDCKLLRFPPFLNNGCPRERHNQCIWESEGYVNYCQVSATGYRIGIWTLHKGDLNDKRNQYPFKWKVKHKGILALPPVTEIEHPSSFSPFAFDDDFEIVYLMSRRSIFSYNLATKEMKEACTSPFEGSDNRALRISLPVLDLSQFDAAAAVTGDKEPCNPRTDEMVKRGKLH